MLLIKNLTGLFFSRGKSKGNLTSGNENSLPFQNYCNISYKNKQYLAYDNHCWDSFLKFCFTYTVILNIA